MLPPIPNPGVNAKVPFRRKQIETNKFPGVFLNLFGFFGDLGVVNGPPPTPIPGVNVKVPFRGEKIWKIIGF